jgi:hypothetical protein
VASTKGGRWSRPDLTETNSSENWGRLSTADRRLLVYGLNGVPGAPVGAGSVVDHKALFVGLTPLERSPTGPSRHGDRGEREDQPANAWTRH